MEPLVSSLCLKLDIKLGEFCDALEVWEKMVEMVVKELRDVVRAIYDISSASHFFT
jgi:hypothetical protein